MNTYLNLLNLQSLFSWVYITNINPRIKSKQLNLNIIYFSNQDFVAINWGFLPTHPLVLGIDNLYLDQNFL